MHHTIIHITAIASRGLIAAYSVESRMYGRSGKHGGYARCKEAGCEKYAVKRGLCIAHGGSRSSGKKPCEVEGCSTLAKLYGLC